MFENTRDYYTLALLQYQTARFKDMTPDDNLYSSWMNPKNLEAIYFLVRL